MPLILDQLSINKWLENIYIYILLEIKPLAMKRSFFAPFLLASLFSFGSELKANPDSRYELPDPRSSLSENQSNSNDVWYLLNQSVIKEKIIGVTKWRPQGFEKLKITRVSDRTICARLASQEKRWIEQIDLGRQTANSFKNYKYKAHTKCIKGRNENEANYVLKMASINMKLDYNDQYINLNDQVEYSSFDTLYFKDLSQCNFAKSQLDNWFTTLENKYLNNTDKRIKKYSTKCFSKT